MKENKQEFVHANNMQRGHILAAAQIAYRI